MANYPMHEQRNSDSWRPPEESYAACAGNHDRSVHDRDPRYWQHRGWQHDSPTAPHYAEAYSYDENPEDFYEPEKSTRHSPFRGSRSQDNGEPWPRNEDRENYSAASERAFDARTARYFDVNPRPPYRLARQEVANCNQAYEPAQNAAGDAFHATPVRSRYTSSAANNYSRSYTSTQGWQEREGAQVGAFGMQTQRGKGPHGYARADERIREDICERLTEHHFIDASGITVEVKDGVVTLAGSVYDRWQKYQTEELADATNGVKDIDNRLIVARGTQPTTHTEFSDKGGSAANPTLK